MFSIHRITLAAFLFPAFIVGALGAEKSPASSFLNWSPSLLTGSVDATDSGNKTPARIWPAFPPPQEVWVQTEPKPYAERILQESAAGLAANYARKSGTSGVYVWIVQRSQPDYEKWFQAWLSRTKIKSHPFQGDVWELVHELQQRGIIKGYVLYKQGPPMTPEDKKAAAPPKDLSVNVATSLCGPLQAVAVEENLQSQAEKQGLKLLADCRGKDTTWLLQQTDKLSHDEFALLDPRTTSARDMAIACDALTVHDSPGGGFEQALDYVKPGGFVFGWGWSGESKFVSPITLHGLYILALTASYNLPLLTSVPDRLSPAPKNNADQLLKKDTPNQHYAAFVLTDGDNPGWNLGHYAFSPTYFGDPTRGQIPFGWGMSTPVVQELSPDAWNYFAHAATPNDDFIQHGVAGYSYVDETATPLLTDHAKNLNLTLAATGLDCMMMMTHGHWDAPAAKAGYQTIIQNCPSLHGMLALQYSPYSAGHGAMFWFPRGNENIPVVSARVCIWNGAPKRPQPTVDFATPELAATLLNKWAQAPLKTPDDRFTWVIVHAWSDFGGGVKGYSAAEACVKQLDPSIKVIKPSELLDLIYATHNQNK